MKTNFLKGFFLALLAVAMLPLSLRASDESDVREMVNKVFEQLKSHDYESLYDVLPGSSRSRMSRDRFVSSLERAQGVYELDKLEIGAVKVSGNIAVVDTVLYGRVTIPAPTEGKIVVQQYLVKEDGKWRVATGDQTTIKKFLAANPEFNKGFRIRPPKIYVKQNGKWVEFMARSPQRRRA